MLVMHFSAQWSLKKDKITDFESNRETGEHRDPGGANF